VHEGRTVDQRGLNCWSGQVRRGLLPRINARAYAVTVAGVIVIATSLFLERKRERESCALSEILSVN